MPDRAPSNPEVSLRPNCHARGMKNIPLSRTLLRRRFRAGLLRLLRPDTRLRLAKTCAGIAALALFIWLYNHLDLGRVLDQDWLDAHIRSRGAWGYPLFILLAAGVTSAAGPRQLVSFAGGYVYGAGVGLLLSLAGALIGCSINFFAARRFAGKLPHPGLDAHCKRIGAVARRSPLLMTIAVRLLPVGNNTLTSLTAGLCDIPAVPFLLGSAIGYLPMTAVFATLGSGLQMDSGLNVALSIGLFAACLTLGLYLVMKLKLKV